MGDRIDVTYRHSLLSLNATWSLTALSHHVFGDHRQAHEYD